MGRVVRGVVTMDAERGTPKRFMAHGVQVHDQLTQARMLIGIANIVMTPRYRPNVGYAFHLLGITALSRARIASADEFLVMFKLPVALAVGPHQLAPAPMVFQTSTSIC